MAARPRRHLRLVRSSTDHPPAFPHEDPLGAARAIAVGCLVSLAFFAAVAVAVVVIVLLV